MLQNLPIEVTLSILDHLSVHEILACQLVHSTWNEIVGSNESIIFLKAALRFGLARLGDTLEDAHWKLREDGSNGVGSWKEVCESDRSIVQKRWLIDLSDSRLGPSFALLPSQMV